MSNSAIIPCITLNSGNKLPIVGLGTSKCTKEEIHEAVKHAIKCGYRHFDGAWRYPSQNGVASALADLIEQGVVKREELFLTNKLWIAFNDPSKVREGLMDSLKAFKTNYFDLYLIHFPVSIRKPDNLDSNCPFTNVDYIDTWKAMVELKKEGLVRDIGVSNFNLYQVDRILKESSVVPAVNQIETHPYLIEEDFVNFCQRNNIAVVAHTPLGCRNYPYRKLEHIVMDDPTLQEIASRMKKSVAQIVLRFQVQRNVAVIPKSVTLKWIEENRNVFDFKLSEEDVNRIRNLDKNFRISDWRSSKAFNNYDLETAKYYPFKDDYSE